jgi:hypothetical protein
MPIFHLARRPPRWLRVALAALLLGFALNTLGHITHRHDGTLAPTAHSLACGYCVSFGSIADGPRHSHSLPTTEYVSVDVADTTEHVYSRRPTTAARPRAPPR